MDYHNFINIPSVGFGLGTIFVALLVLWELIWKGNGLWHAARNNAPGWFIAILLLNTLGILPILYIYVFAPKSSTR